MRIADDSPLLPLGTDVWLSLASDPRRCDLVRVTDVTLDGVTVHDALLGARTVIPLRLSPGRHDGVPTLYAEAP